MFFTFYNLFTIGLLLCSVSICVYIAFKCFYISHFVDRQENNETFIEYINDETQDEVKVFVVENPDNSIVIAN